MNQPSRRPGPQRRVSRNAAYRRRIRRNRIVFALGVIALVSLLALGITACMGSEEPASSAPVSAPVSSAPAASAQPTPAPTPEPTPVPTPEPFVPGWNTDGIEGYPYLVAVNRETQTVTVYAKDEAGNYTVPYKSMICSTGTDTPVGEFRTTDQYTWRALVGGVYGQYATRITGSILFHSVPYYAQDKAQLESEEYNKLGTPASLGCVRLRVTDSKWIYDECPSGTPVVLYDGDSSTDPLGNPGFAPIDLSSPNAGWDPTDPDPANPWNQ